MGPPRQGWTGRAHETWKGREEGAIWILSACLGFIEVLSGYQSRGTVGQGLLPDDARTRVDPNMEHSLIASKTLKIWVFHPKQSKSKP